ncbi:helix-turn-helix transcriptional regulator [Streptantibioticus cattleyicolor]|uniref:LuxR family transcriptional regulator n=1 Tax=Streptantibioticus cattleyicolor (strain ATCC 35852 / DSM 46488 / JCM 4925 / NBRC 14057 / NRRL 8057) TaxID=1003195 RepID=F8JM75_STREN|nr:LuxR family transcriptional regulator [Streptantibioticus cattleyicolor]AEW99395.1 LuxR family transcriptional regulator [Streptantibioticus cattleyicolor NRRL 8057 = DSM 46488]CCB71564.1 putative transcriptional regulator [Streptantibioticus cattleyicolor NRRL 8057 = DSM 46488]
MAHATAPTADAAPTPAGRPTGPSPARAPRTGPAAGRAALLAAARAQLAAGGSVVLTGPAGIGRTHLLSVLADEQAAHGHHLLRCAPARSERDRPFLGLIDLFSATGEDVLGRLAPHQRAVLRAALLRAPLPDGTDLTDGRTLLTVHMALRAAFSALCARGPVLLVVDDVQWLDRPSADALAFVARRAHGLRLAAIAAVRAPVPDNHPERVCPAPALTLRVPPMTVRETAALLQGADPDAPRPPHALVDRVHRAGGGNPFTVGELARAVAERVRPDGGRPPAPDEPLPVTDTLRHALLARLDGLPARARHTLLTAGTALRPTVRLLRLAGCAGAADDIDEAVRHGVVEPPAHGLVRFTDPLLPVVLYEQAPHEQKVRLHTALADAADDPVERAHHQALLTPGSDAGVAARLAEAACSARRRGAPATAARLGRLAADHTPAWEPDVAADRRLTAAEDAVAAGEYALARRLAHEVLGASRHPAHRVRAWNAVVDSSGQAMAEVADVFPQALRDARDDPALLAPLHYRLSWRAWVVEGTATAAHVHAVRAATLAACGGDRHTEVLARTQQAALEFFLGRPEAERTLAAALAEPHDARAMTDHNGPVFLKHRLHLVHDRLDEARTELRALVYTLRQRGSAESLGQCLCALAQVEIHRGRCGQALDLARQSLRIAERAGLSPGPAWYAVALAEAAGGDPGRALAAAEAARRHSEDDGDLLFLPRALHAEGQLRLFLGEYEAAASLLRRVAVLETAQGQGDPAARRWHPDLAEALARTGAADEAAEVIGRARAQAVRLRRPGVLALLERSAALVAEARGDLEAAATGLERAAGSLARLRYPLEEGRARLALGRLDVRRAEAAYAHAALTDALHLFTRAGARPWALLTRAERDRLALRAPSPAPPCDPSWADRLTGTERAVVARVAEGASNREIAAGLVVSVKTVEAALTRAYRKLGVRSRVEVARVVMRGTA